jgi:pyruvate kinase
MKYKNFPNDVNTGERILLDDGKLILKLLKQIKTQK